MLLALGMVCGLLEAARSGQGQVIDAAMVDGAALLFGAAFGMHMAGLWTDQRGTNMLDGGAHFYNTYETKDGKYVALGSIEPQFYALLVEKTGLAGTILPDQMDKDAWPAMKERLAAIFRSKTRDEWCAIMEGSDVCFAPVLSAGEAPHHPQAVARGAYADIDGVPQPAPAPRFSRTPPVARVAPRRGEHTDEVLAGAGFDTDEIAALRATGTIL
jgi:alpha-methylacyl-CoA racemase